MTVGRVCRSPVTFALTLTVILMPLFAASAQDSTPDGKIAFVQDGDIWEWSGSGTSKVIEDGNAQDPTWSPDGRQIMYARNGGSFTNLLIANADTGRITRITDNESEYEEGSPDYVATSFWAVDPYWSASGIVCFVSDAATEGTVMQLWILDPDSGEAYVAADDGGDQGPIEHPSVDENATWVVYTVLSQGGTEGGTTYVTLRDINTGTTYPIIEGPQGAYDPAISPDGNSIVTTIRDESGISDLWLFDRETDELTRLTTDGEATNAVWSPDGDWVAYLHRSGTEFELWAFPIDTGSGEPAGDAQKLVNAGPIDSTSVLSWGEDRR
jgi:Tol biopolymer transport system component